MNAIPDAAARAEAFAALHQAGDADRDAAAALHVAAGAGRHRRIGVPPDRAGAEADRGARRDPSLPALRDEGVVQRHRLHRQHRITHRKLSALGRPVAVCGESRWWRRQFWQRRGGHGEC